MRAKRKSLLLLCMIVSSLSGLDREFLKRQLSEQKEPRIFLLSYPRSGNTWIRYCLEFLTRRSSWHYRGAHRAINRPIGLLAGFLVDLSKSPILKIHSRSEMKIGRESDSTRDLLILVIRNPKEAITRHEGKPPTEHMLKGLEGDKSYMANVYFDNIRVYESWHPAKRLLVYYEDLIRLPKKVLERVLDFLGDGRQEMKKFFEEFELHKATALDLYGKHERSPISRGSDPLYHSKKLSTQSRKTIDVIIERLYPDIWRRYLKGRYAER